MSRRCGCKEVHVYRFPHITYPYILLMYLLFFAEGSLLFVNFLFFVLVEVHKGDYRRPTETV